MMTRIFNRTFKSVTTLAVAASLVTACGGGGASQEDYDSVRDAFNQTFAQFSGSSSEIDISNEEIDCVAKALDVSVQDLDEKLLSEDDSADDESIVEMFRCLDDESARSLFGGFLGSEEDAAAAGVDKNCVLDKIMVAFGDWKKANGTTEELQTEIQKVVTTDAAACTLGS